MIAAQTGSLSDVNTVDDTVSGVPKSADAGERSIANALIETGADVVEVALADAIQRAAAASRFDVLPSLVVELEARRKARLDVVDLATERTKRGR